MPAHRLGLQPIYYQRVTNRWGWRSVHCPYPLDGHASSPPDQRLSILAQRALEVCDGTHRWFVMKGVRGGIEKSGNVRGIPCLENRETWGTQLFRFMLGDTPDLHTQLECPPSCRASTETTVLQVELSRFGTLRRVTVKCEQF